MTLSDVLAVIAGGLALALSGCGTAPFKGPTYIQREPLGAVMEACKNSVDLKPANFDIRHVTARQAAGECSWVSRGAAGTIVCNIITPNEAPADYVEMERENCATVDIELAQRQGRL